jgi:hypothetical protein
MGLDESAVKAEMRDPNSGCLMEHPETNYHVSPRRICAQLAAFAPEPDTCRIGSVAKAMRCEEAMALRLAALAVEGEGHGQEC